MRSSREEKLAYKTGWRVLSIMWQPNSTDRGAWWATLHGVTNSQIGLSDLTLSFSLSTPHAAPGAGNVELRCAVDEDLNQRT